jgi:hypothetical protein
MNKEIVVGQNPLPCEANEAVAKLISELGKKYDFYNGKTAAYLHVCAIIAQHLKLEK